MKRCSDLTIDWRKVLKTSAWGLWYLIRIAAAVLIVWWCFGKVNEWNNFQVFRQWNDHYGFMGSGTYEDPYLINSAEDLIKFSDAVNNGNSFNDIYFRQTADIDLQNYGSFEPIGELNSGYMFSGIYDGGCHKISNLYINANDLDCSFVGLFGKLGGVVMNLGIESGRIYGDYVGAFASTDGSDEAMIINCYNNADLYAMVRCGGIADNFSSGKILGCANYGHLSGMVTCQIVAYDCALISGCCNLETSNDSIVPFDTFRGDMYDCYIGTENVSELNRFIPDYQEYVVYHEITDIDVMPWP